MACVSQHTWRGQRIILRTWSSPSTLLSVGLSDCSSLDSRIAGPQASRRFSCLCLPSYCRGELGLLTFVLLHSAFIWVLGIQTHIIRLEDKPASPHWAISPAHVSFMTNSVPSVPLEVFLSSWFPSGHPALRPSPGQSLVKLWKQAEQNVSVRKWPFWASLQKDFNPSTQWQVSAALYDLICSQNKYCKRDAYTFFDKFFSYCDLWALDPWPGPWLLSNRVLKWLSNFPLNLHKPEVSIVCISFSNHIFQSTKY